MSDDTNTEARFWRLTGQLSGALRRKWAAYDSVRRIPVDGGLILVDLTVDDQQFALSKLLVGKYLSWLLRGEMCAVAYGDARSLPSASADFATAFGCNRVVGLGDAVGQMMAQTPDLRSEVLPLVKGWPLEGEGLRRALLGLTIDGLPVGDLVYDTYLRTGGVATVERLDDRLGGLIADAFLRVRAYNKLFDQHKIRAVIAGHMVYNYFGILSRVAISRGVDVFFDTATNPIRVRRYGDPLAMRQHPYQVSPHELERVMIAERAEAAAFGRRYIAERHRGVRELGYMDGVLGAYGSSRRAYDKQALCAALGWDPARPIVCVMSHIMFESPHSVDGGIFCDILDWLRQTLAFAADRPGVNWLLKPHPVHMHYDRQVAHTATHQSGDAIMTELTAPYRDVPHIGLCPADINTASLAGVVQAVVTQHGTAGYEFGACGVPTLTAARAPYGRLGFTIDPRTKEEYFAALDRLGESEPLSEAQIDQACGYIYARFAKTSLRTPLFPEMSVRGHWAPARNLKLLEAMLERLDAFAPEEDPVYHGLAAMLRRGEALLGL